MGFGGDDLADLFKMLLHGLGVGIWHHQGCTLVVLRADRAEDIGVFVALISRLARACAFRSPLVNLAVLLADAGFILKPQFNRLVRGNVFQDIRQFLREVFSKLQLFQGLAWGAGAGY